VRHLALVLVAAFLAHPLSAQEPKPANKPIRVYMKVEELNPDADGKAKVLAEPVLLATLGKPITFNCGEDVPLKIPLAEGLESIEYVATGIKWEMTCERIIGDAVWLNLVSERIRVVDGKDGLFTTESHSMRQRGKLKIGKTMRMEPIKVDPDSNRQIQFEFRLETSSPSGQMPPGK
jgi:hypothetical protein